MIQWMHAPFQVLGGHPVDGRPDPELCGLGHCRRLHRRLAPRSPRWAAPRSASADFQRTYRNFLRNQSQQMGSEITPDMAQKMGLGQVALQQMVSRTALDNEAAQAGPDHLRRGRGAECARHGRRSAAPLGQFDRHVFLQAIAVPAIPRSSSWTKCAQDMTRDQLTQAMEGNFVAARPPMPRRSVPVCQRKARRRLCDRCRRTQAGDVAAAQRRGAGGLCQGACRPLSTPEYRDVDYAAIAPADVMGQVTVTDAQIAAGL